MSSKAERDAEIERTVDIAVADENARLDVTELCSTCQIAQRLYCPPEHRERRVTTETAAVADDFQPLIEESAGVNLCAGPPEPEPTPRPAGFGYQLDNAIEEVRARVPSYPPNVRVDVGLLLEVIDAYRAGRI